MNIRRPIETKKKRDRQDSKKKLVLIAGSIAVFAIVIGAVFGAKQSSVFRIDTISVKGVPEAYGAQVKQLLGDFSRERSGVFRFLGSDNMIAWDSTPKEFLEEHPEFTVVRLEKDYVRKAITIEVSSREKFGVWCRTTQNPVTVSGEDEVPPIGDIVTVDDSAEQCYWFDRDGVLFARAPKVDSELFNRVYDFTGRALGLRDKILPDRLFINLARVFKLMEVAQINTKTVSLYDIALEEAEADSVSDPRTIFSLRIDPSFSLSAINELKRDGIWHGLQYANFTVENRVSYK